jgi:hypothetical protein
MTNRYSHVVDRSRALSEALHKASPEERERFSKQLEVLFKRASIGRMAITLATSSVLLAAVLVIMLFLTAFFQLDVVPMIFGLFITCMGLLIVSLLFLLRDVNLSLAALKLEVQSVIGQKSGACSPRPD